jgi:hypothetical protein
MPKSLKEQWDDFCNRVVIHDHITEQQLKVCRFYFYGGMVSMGRNMLEVGELTNEESAKYLAQIDKDVRLFGEEVLSMLSHQDIEKFMQMQFDRSNDAILSREHNPPANPEETPTNSP